MKALVGAFNQEKVLVGAFSVIVQPVVEPMDRFTELIPGSDLRLVVGVGGLKVSAPAVAAGDVGQVQVGSAHPAEGGLVGELFIIFQLEKCSN